MKKVSFVFVIIICLALICVIFLHNTFPKAKPIILPETYDIKSITLTVKEENKNYSDKKVIENIISALKSSKPTRKQSISDNPPIDIDYIKIDFVLSNGTNTLFIYEKDDKYFAERPYTGIYSIDKPTYDLIKSIYELI